MDGPARRSFLAPTGRGRKQLMRDPCLLRGPDGIFRLVWTTSWTGVTIGYASSKEPGALVGRESAPGDGA